MASPRGQAVGLASLPLISTAAQCAAFPVSDPSYRFQKVVRGAPAAA
jgi:hypothetical protein